MRVMTTLSRSLVLGLALGLAAAAPAPAHAQGQRDTLVSRPADPAPDSVLRFRPLAQFFDSTGHEPSYEHEVWFGEESETGWLQAPLGDRLLDHPDPWSTGHGNHFQDTQLLADYNRVDLLRFGLHYQAQAPRTMYPRLGARIEYATGRKQTLYGVQMEQPLLPTARFVFGFGLVRLTDHPDLQQVDDPENTAAMLLARTDYRDYFEREGAGVYVSWRVPDFSTVSLHMRGDEYRSLGLNRSVRSWFRTSRELRENPAIDDGRTRSVLFRLERLARRSAAMRAGFYHAIELERAGGELGGDFDYLRLLGDLRSVLRLSPATTLSLRAVAGTCTDGALPRQRQFPIGGVDGLRAHPLGSFRGSQVALAQAEYTVGLWALRGEGLEAGLHALAFVDAGSAWDNPANRWDLERQHLATDVGVGLATNEDDLRVYVARDLHDASAGWTWSVRLRRPF